jgi:hypothetical protein
VFRRGYCKHPASWARRALRPWHTGYLCIPTLLRLSLFRFVILVTVQSVLKIERHFSWPKPINLIWQLPRYPPSTHLNSNALPILFHLPLLKWPLYRKPTGGKLPRSRDLGYAIDMSKDIRFPRSLEHFKLPRSTVQGIINRRLENGDDSFKNKPGIFREEFEAQL